MQSALSRAAAFVLLSAGIISAGPTSLPTWQPYANGKLLLRPFDSAPYPHPSRANGYKNKYGDFPATRHYSDSTVGIFIPPDFKPTDKTNFIIHFHGWGNHVENVLAGHKLAEQLAATHVNAVLLVPQGPKDASDSGCGKLELDEDGFKRFITEAIKVLNDEGITPSPNAGKILLSAHSGGYKVTASILHRGGMNAHITDVILLDASYGNLDWFANWLTPPTTRPDIRLVSFFTEHLKDENILLQGLLDKSSIKWHLDPETDIAKDPARGAIFSPTTKPHNDVSKFFGDMISTSALAKAP